MPMSSAGGKHCSASSYKYTVPCIPESLNYYAGRNNSFEYRKDKKQWCGWIKLCCRPVPPVPIEKARVHLIYYFPTKVRHDPDNYSGKFILDGLTRAGIIKDDSFDCIELVLTGGYDKNNPRLEILIEELTDVFQEI